MNVSHASAYVDRTTYAERMQARAALEGAVDARKRAVEEGAGKGLSSPRLEAPERIKQQARAKVQSLIERLKILKKMFGANPKEMARAVTQLAKELKAAVKAYQAAGGKELQMAGDLAHPSAPRTNEAKPDEAQADEAQTKALAEEPAPEEDQRPPAEAAAAERGAAFYDAVETKMRESIGQDGLDFAKLVRTFAEAVKDVLNASRGQAMVKKPDKDTKEAFEDADEAFKDLGKALDDMEREIRREVPTLGLRVDIAA